MEWTIKIEKKTNQRIMVKFDALNEELIFIGQYRLHNVWKDFVRFSVPLWGDGATSNLGFITVETIKSSIANICEILRKRVDAYDNIAEGFTLIKEVGMPEDEENESGGLMM